MRAWLTHLLRTQLHTQSTLSGGTELGMPALTQPGGCSRAAQLGSSPRLPKARERDPRDVADGERVTGLAGEGKERM